MPYLEAVHTALNRCGILAQHPSFETFSDNIKYTIEDVQKAVELAADFFRKDDRTKHVPPDTKIQIDLQYTGSHLIAFGNLMIWFALTMGKPYSKTELEHWSAIMTTVYETFESSSLSSSSATSLQHDLILRFHHRVAAKNIDLTDSGFVYFRDQVKLSARRDGALSMLIEYMVLVCQKCYLENRRRSRVRKSFDRWLGRL